MKENLCDACHREVTRPREVAWRLLELSRAHDHDAYMDLLIEDVKRWKNGPPNNTPNGARCRKCGGFQDRVRKDEAQP